MSLSSEVIRSRRLVTNANNEATRLFSTQDGKGVHVITGEKNGEIVRAIMVAVNPAFLHGWKYPEARVLRDSMLSWTMRTYQTDQRILQELYTLCADSCLGRSWAEFLHKVKRRPVGKLLDPVTCKNVAAGAVMTRKLNYENDIAAWKCAHVNAVASWRKVDARIECAMRIADDDTELRAQLKKLKEASAQIHRSKPKILPSNVLLGEAADVFFNAPADRILAVMGSLPLVTEVPQIRIVDFSDDFDTTRLDTPRPSDPRAVVGKVPDDFAILKLDISEK